MTIDFIFFLESLQEPWDGPALLAFSDGRYVGKKSYLNAWN